MFYKLEAKREEGRGTPKSRNSLVQNIQLEGTHLYKKVKITIFYSRNCQSVLGKISIYVEKDRRWLTFRHAECKTNTSAKDAHKQMM